jgi:hypothetical protein
MEMKHPFLMVLIFMSSASSCNNEDDNINTENTLTVRSNLSYYL